MVANPDSNDEIKDKIHFAIQGSADFAQITIAVAVGLSGILSIFAIMQTPQTPHFGHLWWYGSDAWKLAVFGVLSVAYWGILVLGFKSISLIVMVECTLIDLVRQIYTKYL